MMVYTPRCNALLESEARSESVRGKLKYQDRDGISYLSQLRNQTGTRRNQTSVQIPRYQEYRESQGSEEYVVSFEDLETGEVFVYKP